MDRSLFRASRGTSKTLMEAIGRRNLVRRDGALVTIPAGRDKRVFDFDGKKVPIYGLPWGDVSTAYRTTGIPNIETFMDLPPLAVFLMKAGNYAPGFWQSRGMQAYLKGVTNLFPRGPSSEIRETKGTIIVGEVSNARGDVARSMLRTPDGYQLTSLTAVAAAKAVLGGEHRPGHRTPGALFGPDFILGFPGVERTDI